MNNKKIIKAESQKEVVRIFRRLTASGVINGDKATEIIMRDYPHYFHPPSENDIVETNHLVMNDEIRSRARQSNRLFNDIFRGPADKQKTS